MATPLSGRRGRAKLNGINAQVEEWSIQCKTDILEATTFESQNLITGRTARRVLDGIDSLTISVKGYVDADAIPTNTVGLNLNPGANVALELYINKTGNVRWIINTAILAQINNMVNVKGRAEFDITVESNGEWTAPS